VAESCTSGLLSNLIGANPGASKYYLGGLIAYQNKVKEEWLGVSKAALRKSGAVSSRVAREMAIGCRKKFGTQYSVSITGIAGPTGGTAGKPIGLVYIGIAAPQSNFVFRYHFLGNRASIQEKSAHTALVILLRILLKLKPYKI
jgi:PncC family amidohydrolase